MTLQEIKQNESIRALVHAGNKYLEAMGYTDHGPRHVGYVSDTASRVLRCLGYDDHQVELAAIAGWVHDVGNAINRHNHGANGAILLTRPAGDGHAHSGRGGHHHRRGQP